MVLSPPQDTRNGYPYYIRCDSTSHTTPTCIVGPPLAGGLKGFHATQEVRAVFDVACVILAGGRSRRMGQDKGLLALPGDEGITFAERLVSTLAPLCRETLLVARDEVQAAQYASVAAHAIHAVEIVTDRVPGSGPLMGLYSGLGATQAKRALVVAVDMPFVRPELASFLLSQPSTKIDADTTIDTILVPIVDDVPQVMFAIYPRAILPLIEARLREGRRDPRSLLEVAPVRYIKEAQLRAVDPQLRSFVNINTPQDLLSEG
jgi:molybdenum cofactor guanylyltransferase